mmetsp:Transcript_56481/g.112127  ORF Transcript_56481/g.112127 Transcript_56481/m.112127 type:complete len:419 (-) Transcript_56481:70-1326(-)
MAAAAAAANASEAGGDGVQACGAADVIAAAPATTPPSAVSATAATADTTAAADPNEGIVAQPVTASPTATDFETATDALDSPLAVSAAAAVALPRAAWWACCLLLDEGIQCEAAGDKKEALRRYVAASRWQPLHVLAAANAARLLQSVDNDMLSAAAACIQIVRSSAVARMHASNAAWAALADDEDEDEWRALKAASKCAFDLMAELEELLRLLRNGFAHRPPEEGPPSEVPVARQQGKLAIAMDAEQRRQQAYVDRERPGVDQQTVPAADAIRRKRVVEATMLGGKLLHALAADPSRLFDTNDGSLTTMLWGVETSTQRLQAALSRGGRTSATQASDSGGGSTADPPTAAESSENTALPPLHPRAPQHTSELSARLLHWGDDGMDSTDLYTPVTDRIVQTSKREGSIVLQYSFDGAK